MARSTDPRSLRKVIFDLKRLRGLRFVKGRWVVKKALTSRRFANAGVEVVGVDTGRSVMTLMQNDASDFRAKDLEYLIELHNVFPDLAEYIGNLEHHVGRQRGALVQTRDFLEGFIRQCRDRRADNPIPEVVLDRLDTVIRECTAAMAERGIPDYVPQPPERRRAIRVEPFQSDDPGSSPELHS